MRYKDLLNTNDILHLLTTRLNFTPKQMGKSIFILCPFHSDKNPSLSFEPSRKIFTCFSCGFKASDIFDFWAQYKNIGLEESLVEISKLGYFSLANWQEKKKREQKGKNRIFYLNSLVADIYQHNLFTERGQEVLDYLQKKRRLNYSMIARFSLGCTISNKQLTNLLFQQKSDNFSSADLLATNLVLITGDNRTSDFFSEKQLIIPLVNAEDGIIAFASRKIEEVEANEGKYKYLPSYQYYHKSSLLYNYSMAKKSREEEVYLVEGFFDIISLVELGIENCTAILGTSLSEDQIKLLKNLQKKIVLFLDGDEAGKEATINILVKLLLREIDCEVIKGNYDGDPDEICHQYSKETIRGFLKRRQNPYLFILDSYFSKWEVAENPQRVSHFIREVAKNFQNFKLNIRDFLVEKLSLLVKWNKEEIESYFIKRNFPFPNLRYLQIIYCQELIQKKEVIIIQLCIQSRNCWIITMKKNYYFFNKDNRRNYWNIYNYYILNPFDNFFPSKLNKLSNNYSVSLEKNQRILEGSSKLINKVFQEIDHIKKFKLTYEKKYCS